jgi:hypothetical protein
MVALEREVRKYSSVSNHYFKRRRDVVFTSGTRLDFCSFRFGYKVVETRIDVSSLIPTSLGSI